MPGKRLEKCSTCTRVFSLRSSSWASWVNSSWENISRPGKERMKGAVLAVVDLARAFIDLHGQAQVALREQRRSEEHTSELQSPCNLVCRLLLEKKKKTQKYYCAYQNKNINMNIASVINHNQCYAHL